MGGWYLRVRVKSPRTVTCGGRLFKRFLAIEDDPVTSVQWFPVTNACRAVRFVGVSACHYVV